MTDLDKLRTTLKEIGLKEEEKKIDRIWDMDQDFVVKEFKDEWGVEKGIVLTIGWGEGYGGFFADFIFDENGKFLKHGIYE